MDRGRPAVVTAVSRSVSHGPLKPNQPSIRLVEGLDVEGDAHFGEKVQHLSRKARYPEMPNLRQVHLIHAELRAELREHRPAGAARRYTGVRP